MMKIRERSVEKYCVCEGGGGGGGGGGRGRSGGGDIIRLCKRTILVLGSALTVVSEHTS